jgi:LAO/AO transport system kinase
VLVPESGDSIQTLKAGVMEIADIFVVNKSDRPGADRLRNDVELMLGLRKGASYANVPAHHGVDLKRMNPARVAREDARDDKAETWTPPVLRAVGVKGEGIEEIMKSLDRHFAYLEKSGELRSRRRERLIERVVEVAERRMKHRLWDEPATMRWLETKVDDLEAGKVTPVAVADSLLAEHGNLVTGAVK